MAAVHVRRRRGPAGLAERLRDAELIDVGKQLHAKAGPLGNEAGAADDRLARRPAAVLGRVVLVVREGATVAQRAEVVGESPTRRMEVQVGDVLVARVAEAVDDERRHVGERPSRNDDRLVLDAEPNGQLALEDVEEVAVMAVDVQVRAHTVRPPARPRGVERLVVGDDLDTPVGVRRRSPRLRRAG